MVLFTSDLGINRIIFLAIPNGGTISFTSSSFKSRNSTPSMQFSLERGERDGGGEWYALDSVYMIHVANVPHLIEYHIWRDKREPDVNIGDHITSCDVEFLHYKLLLLIK